VALAIACPGSGAFSQSPPLSPGSTYIPSPSSAAPVSPAPQPAVPPAASPTPQRRAVPLPPERSIPPSAGPVPDGRLECGWVGTRIIGLLVRDDIDGANQYHQFFLAFGCAGDQLAQAFRCTVGGGAELAGAPLNDRITGCWSNPGMSRPLLAPSPRGPADGQGGGQTGGQSGGQNSGQPGGQGAGAPRR